MTASGEAVSGHTDSDAQPAMLRFADFQVDLASGELRKRGVRVKLQEQPFQILVLLLAQPGKVVAREDLRQKLWAADSFVDFDNGLNIAIRKLRQALGDDAESPRYVETVPKRGYRFIAAVSTEPSSGPSISSIAVLPFQNLSGDPSQEYFADGMTDELITGLAQIGSLRVISRTSAMHYKATHKTMPEIGRELNVDALIEGAVMRSGGRVRITAQLVRASEDAHIWAASYEEDITDVLRVQSEVAQAIVHEVRVKLTPQERQRLAKAHSVDPKAYEAYLKGRYYLHKLTEEGLRKGLDHLQQAIAIAPEYAPPFAGMAYYYLAQAEWTLSPIEAMPEARRAAEQAIELDSALPEPHMALGLVHFWYDWDWNGADREFRRAIQLNPSDALTRQYYSQCLAWMGRSEEAIREGKRAVELDPVSVEAAKILGEDYYFLRDYSAAITQLHEALAMRPDYWFAHLSLGRAYLQAGKTVEAIAELEAATRLEPDIPDALYSLGTAYAAAGETDKAIEVLTELGHRAKSRYVPSYNMAIVCASLGRTDRALEWLEKAFQERSIFMTWLRTDPALDPVRSDSRFARLQQRVGLR